MKLLLIIFGVRGIFAMKLSKRFLLLTMVCTGLLYFSACQNNVSTTLEDSVAPYLELQSIQEASNSTVTVNRGAAMQYDSYFAFDISNIETNSFLKEGFTEGWCLEWDKPIAQNNDSHHGIEMYSTFGSNNWKSANYLMNIRNEIQAEDPSITYKELQVALWSVIETPAFELDDVLRNNRMPSRLMKNGQPDFSVKKVKQIVNRVRSEVTEFDYDDQASFFVFANTGEGNQNVGVIKDPESGISCDCSNPVTQSDGTIVIHDGETRCLDQEFSGSVQFETGGTLNVCSTAHFQNISGNAAGIVNITETGDVTVGNWNNNSSADEINNWGILNFSNWTNINQGKLTNYNEISVNGGLNQNNGLILNHGNMSVSQAVTLNKPGNLNEGEWIIGGSLTLNSGSELNNSYRVESDQLMVNGSYKAEAGTFTKVNQQVTVNSGGLIDFNGDNGMLSAASVSLNGSISNNGSNNLLNLSGALNSNSGAAITSSGASLGVCSTNYSSLPAIFQVTNGCNFVIPASQKNPDGFNN